MATLLASFPNSRIKPRPATTQSDTYIATVPSGVATLIAAANVNRTLITVRNNSTSDIYYGYDASITGSVGANGGFLLKAYDSVDLGDPGNIYIFQSSGVAVLVSIDEGEG